MTTYRRRPAVIEAIQWTDTNPDELTAFAGQRFMPLEPDERTDDPEATASVLTSKHSSWELLYPGQWVLKDDQGRVSIWYDEEFRATYEPAAASVPSAPTQTADADRRDRYAQAIRDTDGWVLDGGQHMLDAVLAVADAEQAELRERHKAGLRRADEINNSLMEEVQRYAAGDERPVLWSVYNEMHKRALKAEAEAYQYRTALQGAARAAVPAAVGEQPSGLVCVCGDPIQLRDEIDPGSWIHSPGSDTPCLNARPRCPHCQLPHDLTPGSLPVAACQNTRQLIADAERSHAEGDHSLCRRVDCEVLRQS